MDGGDAEEPGILNERGQRVHPREIIREIFAEIGIVFNPLTGME